MEFDGLFEDLELCAQANKGAIGLEYIRQGKHLGEAGEFRPDVKSMLEGASQLCALMLPIRYDKIKDHERAERFLQAGQRELEFESRDWQRKARKFRTIIKDLLAGEISLSEDEIVVQQHFLVVTSSVLLESIHLQQRAFMDARGIHRL